MKGKIAAAVAVMGLTTVIGAGAASAACDIEVQVSEPIVAPMGSVDGPDLSVVDGKVPLVQVTGVYVDLTVTPILVTPPNVIPPPSP